MWKNFGDLSPDIEIIANMVKFWKSGKCILNIYERERAKTEKVAENMNFLSKIGESGWEYEFWAKTDKWLSILKWRVGEVWVSEYLSFQVWEWKFWMCLQVMCICKCMYNLWWPPVSPTNFRWCQLTSGATHFLRPFKSCVHYKCPNTYNLSPMSPTNFRWCQPTSGTTLFCACASCACVYTCSHSYSATCDKCRPPTSGANQLPVLTFDFRFSIFHHLLTDLKFSPNFRQVATNWLPNGLPAHRVPWRQIFQISPWI